MIFRDQKFRVSVSVDTLAKLWLQGERRNMTGPMVASRILEEIGRQGSFEMFLNAARNRGRKERRAERETPKEPAGGGSELPREVGEMYQDDGGPPYTEGRGGGSGSGQ